MGRGGFAQKLLAFFTHIWDLCYGVYTSLKSLIMQSRASRLVSSAVGVVVLVSVVLLISTAGGQAGTPLPGEDPVVAGPGAGTQADALPEGSAMPEGSAAPAVVQEDAQLKEGTRSERVKKLQQRLMKLGYLDSDEATDYFGGATNYAVQLFQRQHNLQVDGIAGGRTIDLINSDEAKKYTLLEGTRGTDVDSFQRRLKQLGYLSTVTGYYGTDTVKAVKAFQSRNGLYADGKAGEQTFELIFSPKAKPAPDTASVTHSGGRVDGFINAAAGKLGCKYILGNEGPSTFDCSGLVYYCLRQAGVSTGRYTAAGYSQVSQWERISSMGSLRRGDVLFFRTNGKRVGHTGIYIGGGMMIDASSSNGKVIKRSCTTSFWKGAFVGARRVFK